MPRRHGGENGNFDGIANMIAIIDYDAGNLTSVQRAVSHLGYPCEVTSDTARIRAAERVIFPGVGAAASAMRSLTRAGLDEALRDAFTAGKPVLGICLGTQIITGFSEEDGGTPCLNLIPGRVRAFPRDMRDDNGRPLKIPHMGWNRLDIRQPHPVLANIQPEDEFYFVHGYYPTADDPEQVIGETTHGLVFSSVIGLKNLIATQFHPEKSGRPGLIILKNFCEWIPC